MKKIYGILVAGAIILITISGSLHNNAKAESYKPDLIVTNIQISGLRIESTTNWIRAYVQNNGDVTCTQDFYVDFWQDSQTGRYLGKVKVTKDLAPGEGTYTSWKSFVWQGGGHYFFTKADSTGLVSEKNEDNNWFNRWFYGFKSTND